MPRNTKLTGSKTTRNFTAVPAVDHYLLGRKMRYYFDTRHCCFRWHSHRLMNPTSSELEIQFFVIWLFFYWNHRITCLIFCFSIYLLPDFYWLLLQPSTPPNCSRYARHSKKDAAHIIHSVVLASNLVDILVLHLLRNRWGVSFYRRPSFVVTRRLFVLIYFLLFVQGSVDYLDL